MELTQTDIIRTVLPTLVGLFVGLYLQWWKSFRDERRILGDDACKVTRLLVDAAADYWIETDSEKLRRAEPKVIGQQTELSELVDIFRKNMLYDDRNQLKEALKKLIRLVSGDDFGSRTGVERLDLAHGVHQAGAELINKIRNAQWQRNSLGGAIMALLGR